MGVFLMRRIFPIICTLSIVLSMFVFAPTAYAFEVEGWPTATSSDNMQFDLFDFYTEEQLQVFYTPTSYSTTYSRSIPLPFNVSVNSISLIISTSSLNINSRSYIQYLDYYGVSHTVRGFSFKQLSFQSSDNQFLYSVTMSFDSPITLTLESDLKFVFGSSSTSTYTVNGIILDCPCSSKDSINSTVRVETGSYVDYNTFANEYPYSFPLGTGNFQEIGTNRSESEITFYFFPSQVKGLDYIYLSFTPNVYWNINYVACYADTVPLKYTAFFDDDFSDGKDRSHPLTYLIDLSDVPSDYDSYITFKVGVYATVGNTIRNDELDPPYETEWENITVHDIFAFVVYDEPPNSIIYWLRSIFSRLGSGLGLNDSSGSDAQVTQEQINVEVNNQIVSSVTDWESNIEGITTDSNSFLANVTPALNFVSGLADRIFVNSGWFGKLYIFVGLVTVYMLILSKSGLTSKITKAADK